VPCDIWSPCALGGALNDVTVPELRCTAVCGSANNQLASPEVADALASVGVLYAPDFIVNAGGIVNIAEELSPGGYQRERAYDRVRRIYDTTTAVLQAATAEGITTAAAAEHLAERRIDALGGLGHIRTFDQEGNRG
jgi:glutamate dehydrogenase/leucine dehydrogenase